MKLKQKAHPLIKQNMPSVKTKTKVKRGDHKSKINPNETHELIDEEWLDEVRQMQCCVEGCNNQAIPHHTQSRKRGRRDDLTINVCQPHHVTGGIKQAIHQMGTEAWEKAFNIDTARHAENLWKEHEDDNSI